MTHILSISSEPSSTLAGCRVAVAGKLGSMNRREARDLLRQEGATLIDRIDDSVDLIVIGAGEHSPTGGAGWLDESVLQLADQGQLEIIQETELCQRLKLIDTDLNVDQLYTPAMLADLLDLPLATIRRWHRRGLITPARQIKRLSYFDFEEVASARRLARLIASGASPQTIESKLSRLAQHYPHMRRPLSQLSVIVDGKDLLLRHGEGLAEPSGQLRIDFDLPADQELLGLDLDQSDHPASGIAAVIPLEQALVDSDLTQFTTPAEFIKLATELEDEGETDAAIEIFRAMSLAVGPTADSSFRIAELLYQKHDLAGARERYYMAVELDETFVEARASLGCVLVEMEQYELAHAAFEGALQHHADYPDVHFHLARLLDTMGRPLAAEPHWRHFLELAPKSPWSEEARGRLEPDHS